MHLRIMLIWFMMIRRIEVDQWAFCYATYDECRELTLSRPSCMVEHEPKNWRKFGHLDYESEHSMNKTPDIAPNPLALSWDVVVDAGGGGGGGTNIGAAI